MRCIIVLLALTAISVFPGCSQEQIDRAAQLSAAADVRLAQADQALALAQQAVDQGKALADQVGSVRAEQIVAQAQQALTAAAAARDVAKVASDGSRAALESAKAAQAAGGSTLDVLVAALTAFMPTLAVALTAIRRAINAGQAFRQTVAGIEKAKAAMPADQVAKLHAALAAEQDDAVKQRVSLVKATLSTLVLCVLVQAHAGASELGLGTVPTNTTLTAPGPIGSTTPSSGAFTTLSASSTLGVTGLATLTGGLTSPAAIVSTLATGTAPFTLASTTKVTNLNADQLDGIDSTRFTRCLGSLATGWSHTGDTLEATLTSISIPANTVTSGSCLAVNTYWTYSGTANAKTPRVKLGSTYFLDRADSTSSNIGLWRRVEIWARTSGSQISVNKGSGGFGAQGLAATTGAEDFTATLTLAFTGQCASAGDTITLEAYSVELLAP